MLRQFLTFSNDPKFLKRKSAAEDAEISYQAGTDVALTQVVLGAATCTRSTWPQNSLAEG